MPIFGAAYAYAAPNKGTTILYWLWSPKTVLNPPVNGKIQGLFKALECFSRLFQGKVNFQGLFKTVLYIQVLFKPVWTLYFKNIPLLCLYPSYSVCGSCPRWWRVSARRRPHNVTSASAPRILLYCSVWYGNEASLKCIMNGVW